MDRDPRSVHRIPVRFWDGDPNETGTKISLGDGWTFRVRKGRWLGFRTTGRWFRERDSEALALSEMDAIGARRLLDLYRICSRLKGIKRTGWVRRGVRDPESVADHMHRVSFITLTAGEWEGVDTSKAVKMAIVHDLAEAIVGDIAPGDGISKKEKHEKEKKAMEEMVSLVSGPVAQKEIMELWEEYELGESPEAMLVKDIDKLEMIIQAQEYEEDQGILLQEFFDSTRGKFKTNTARLLAEELNQRRGN